MPTFDQLIRSLEADFGRAQAQHDRAHQDIKAIVARAEARGDKNLSVEEDRECEKLFAEKREARSRRDDLDVQLRDARDAQAEERKFEQAQQVRNVDPAARPAMRTYDQVARIGAEERTYHAGMDRTGKGFLLDVARGFLFHDPASQERLARHGREEQVERGQYMQRAVGTGAFVGLTVPQYLTDLYAPAVAALRPLANIATHHALPESGMALNISRVTTATGVALQASENAAVQNTDADDTLLTVNVQTAAGQQTVSRQAIERGTGVEDVTLNDMFRRYATTLDSTMINQATTGIAATGQVTTYTSAAPTAAEFWPFLFQAQSKLEQALLGQATADYVVMHSRRWNWLCSQVGTSWPFIGSANGAPTQAGGVIVTNEYGSGVRGILSNGLKVIVDNNVPTTTGGTQDEVYVVASGELHLWEDPNAPVYIRAEQPAAGSLGVLMVVYGYFGYTAQRYGNNPGRIFGTGTAAPAGF